MGTVRTQPYSQNDQPTEETNRVAQPLPKTNLLTRDRSNGMVEKYRGIKRVLMISTLEGDGKDVAYREVKTFVDEDTLQVIATHDPLIEKD